MSRIPLLIPMTSKTGMKPATHVLTLMGSSIIVSSFDPPVTQAHHAGALDPLVLLPQKMKHHLPDLDALLPNFGWVSKEYIWDTLEETTQLYQADQHVPMHKHFHSGFPAANIRHLPEWFSMDTFIADILAVDDSVPGHGGYTMLQVYGGLDSELLYGHPISTKSELPDTLHDFI